MRGPYLHTPNVRCCCSTRRLAESTALRRVQGSVHHHHRSQSYERVHVKQLREEVGSVELCVDVTQIYERLVPQPLDPLLSHVYVLQLGSSRTLPFENAMAVVLSTSSCSGNSIGSPISSTMYDKCMTSVSATLAA